MVLGNLIGGFIVILIGVNLIPSVADSVEAATTTGNGTVNVSGTAVAILDLTTVFFALGVMAAGVGLATGALREAGLI